MPSEKILFFSEDIDFRYKEKQKTRKWINTIVSQENKKLRSLNIIFCSDSFLLSINQEYLQHDTYTDIITFEYSEDDTYIEGDIYISIDRISENAKNLDNTFETELKRVIIHGVLHLCGYADKTEKEQQEMRTKEDISLQIFNTI
ncbi:rRNA maturation RNase YbeY [Cytophagaceae bacterium ABcell3]|nr:rRNA maturation RNase YbeY [Cytophagaceae bacterium ABcell3]